MFMTAKYRANPASSTQLQAEWLPQDNAISLAFCANKTPTEAVNLSILLCDAVCSFAIMAVTKVASFELRMLLTYFAVRSIVARSSLVRARYQIPLLRAAFFT